MKKSRYTEFQIVKILKEVEGGRLVKEVFSEYGISDGTYYNWKSKYGGMEASDVRRLKDQEEEDRRLKQMYCPHNMDYSRHLLDLFNTHCCVDWLRDRRGEQTIDRHVASIKGVEAVTIIRPFIMLVYDDSRTWNLCLLSR